MGNLNKSKAGHYHVYQPIIHNCCFLQHIITQDFARNQDPPPVSSSSSAPFQSTVPHVSSSGRSKMPSRYSPENQVPASHHQRPSSRVSPENTSDKLRSRYVEQPVIPEISRMHLMYYSSSVNNFSLSPPCLGRVNLQSVVSGRWSIMNPSLHHRATKAWTNRRRADLLPKGERLTTLRSGTGFQIPHNLTLFFSSMKLYFIIRSKLRKKNIWFN